MLSDFHISRPIFQQMKCATLVPSSISIIELTLTNALFSPSFGNSFVMGLWERERPSLSFQLAQLFSLFSIAIHFSHCYIQSWEMWIRKAHAIALKGNKDRSMANIIAWSIKYCVLYLERVKVSYIKVLYNLQMWPLSRYRKMFLNLITTRATANCPLWVALKMKYWWEF